MRLTHKFTVTDFNFRVSCGHSDQEGMAHERRQNRLLSTVRISSPSRFPPVRPQLSGRLQGLEFFLPRSISLHGLRATDVPGAVSYTHLRAHETKANIVCR